MKDTNAIDEILSIAAGIISDKTYSTNYASSDYEYIEEHLPEARAQLAKLRRDRERLEWLHRNKAVDGADLQEPFVRIEARRNPHNEQWTWWIESYSSDAYPICTKSWEKSFPTFRAALTALVPGLVEAEEIMGELLENSDMVWVPYGYNDRADFEYYKCRYCGKKYKEGRPESHCTNPACPAVRARAMPGGSVE